MIQILRHYKFTSLICLGAIAFVNKPLINASHAETIAQADASLLEVSPTVPVVDNTAPATDGTSREELQSSEQKMTVATYIKQGNDAYVEAKYEDAISAYTKAIELYNQNAYAYYNRGNAYRKLKNEEAALKDYTLAIRFNPDNYYAYYYRGILLSDAKNYEQAITDFSAALELTDQTPSIFVKRADTYTKLKNKDAAKQDYKKAIDLYKKLGQDVKAELLQRKIGGVRR